MAKANGSKIKIEVIDMEVTCPVKPDIDMTVYMPPYVEVRRLTQMQRVGLRRLMDGLVFTGQCIQTGPHRGNHPVKSGNDAIRWLLEQIGQ